MYSILKNKLCTRTLNVQTSYPSKCRFYSDDANENSEYRAAGYTIELRDTGQYGFELPPDQVP